MICPNCGMEFDEKNGVCPLCRFALDSEIDEEQIQISENESEPSDNNFQNTNQQISENVIQKKNSKILPIVIAIIAILLVAGIAIAAFFTMNNKNNNSDNKSILENNSIDTSTETEEISISEKAIEENSTQASTVVETTTEETTIEETKAEESGQYEIFFSADELLKDAGLEGALDSAHIVAAVASNVKSSSGKAEVKTEDVCGFANLISVTVTGATEKEVVLSGTITTYGVDSYEGQEVTYSDQTGAFMYKKSADDTSSDSQKSNNAAIQTYDLGEGFFGTINASEGSVDGLTTNYVVNGGEYEVQHHVQDGWRIIAKTKCTSMGITWYECWDADDGDYYGWIDSSFLFLYNY